MVGVARAVLAEVSLVTLVRAELHEGLRIAVNGATPGRAGRQVRRVPGRGGDGRGARVGTVVIVPTIVAAVLLGRRQGLRAVGGQQVLHLLGLRLLA